MVTEGACPSNIKISTRTVRLLGKGECMTEDMTIKVFCSFLHTRQVWGAASVMRLLVWHVAHHCRTGSGEVCGCEDHELHEWRAETSGHQKHCGAGCCQATQSPTAEPTSCLLISSIGSDQHQQKALEGPVLSRSLCHFSLGLVCPPGIPFCWRHIRCIDQCRVSTAAWAQLRPMVPLLLLAAECTLFMNGALDVNYSGETQHFIQQLCYLLCGIKQFVNVTLL